MPSPLSFLQSGRRPQMLRSETLTLPAGSEVRTVFRLRAARDPETGRLIVASPEHGGLAFEAEDFTDAMRCAADIVPEFAIAAGFPKEGVAIVLDEYPSIDDLDLDSD